MEEIRAEIPEDISVAFTEVSQSARLTFHMVRSCGDPREGSNFKQVNEFYPFEKVSDRARHYVTASLEHLNMWADHAAPMKFHPDHQVVFWMRPTYALARAALETAAQAVWLMDATDPKICAQRHLRLVRWDLQEHRKSRLDQAGKDLVKEREAILIERVARVFTADEIKPPDSYRTVIRDACRPDDLALDADEAERVWRAASGAAHGMYWTNLDLQETKVGEEFEPGFFRTQSIPNAELMLGALRVAQKMTQYAGLKYITWGGHDPDPLAKEARSWLADRITFKPDANPETVAFLKGEQPKPETSTNSTQPE